MIRFILFSFFQLVFLMMFSVTVFSSTVIGNMELVLAEDGVLIDGFKDVDLILYDGSGDVLWMESHEDVSFYTGICTFEFGTINEIVPFHFYESDIQFIVRMRRLIEIHCDQQHLVYFHMQQIL